MEGECCVLYVGGCICIYVCGVCVCGSIVGECCVYVCVCMCGVGVCVCAHFQHLLQLPSPPPLLPGVCGIHTATR